MLLPVAMVMGEVWTTEYSEKTGFLDRSELHTPGYLSLNVFAGEEVFRCFRICYCGLF